MNECREKDRLYADPREVVADFVFDERVAAVFPDMIQRSVPGYATIINMIGTLASRCVTPAARCYDLGCSLGAAALAMHRGVGNHALPIVAVDNSPAMLDQARRKLAEAADLSAFDLVCADLLEVPIDKASMVVLNFTLQFIEPSQRPMLLQKIHQGLQAGGILVLSEKIALDSAPAQRLFTDMHHRFKKAQGYSELEISQKRTALERVLLPETLERHTSRLREAGFSTVEVWFQCFNFVSLLAIK
jgi:tRNA (cmo5U34)-methyltransferase